MTGQGPGGVVATRGLRAVGGVVATRGSLVEAELPFARVGDGVRVCARDVAVNARIASLQGTRALVAPFGGIDGVAVGDRVEADPAGLALLLGTRLLGRAIDAAGLPLDGRPAPRGRRTVTGGQPHAVGERRPCADVFWTGLRAIDGPLALGRGARIGLFGAPGAGK
ncbi:MAG: flagellum-specific synthase, partial [Candidatus Eremiobacteraeota bacterium]|nr:flagellum-specific synthase [Candidatus Eremiobacteraeota bacterium]